jgi:hypothetical protein
MNVCTVSPGILRFHEKGRSRLCAGRQEVIMQCMRDTFPGPLLRHHDPGKGECAATVLMGETRLGLGKRPLPPAAARGERPSPGLPDGRAALMGVARSNSGWERRSQTGAYNVSMLSNGSPLVIASTYE